MRATINEALQRYEHDGRVVDFDDCIELIERICIELKGRGKVPPRYNAPHGTLAAYAALIAFEGIVARAAEADGETPVAGLTSQFHELEGHRVRVITTYGEERTFIVGVSDDPVPRHTMIEPDGTSPAEFEYMQVHDLGPA